MNKSESKYFNTALKMDEAIIHLLEKKDFEYITVKEICAEAGVNRSTFYLHYENTADLLCEAGEYIIKLFESYFPKENKNFLDTIADCSKEELVLVDRSRLKPYLQFAKDNRKIFKAIISNSTNFTFDETYEKLKKHVIFPILRRFNYSEVEQKYVASYYVNGCIAIVEQWLLEDSKEDIEVIADIIIKCTNPVKFGGNE